MFTNKNFRNFLCLPHNVSGYMLPKSLFDECLPKSSSPPTFFVQFEAFLFCIVPGGWPPCQISERNIASLQAFSRPHNSISGNSCRFSWGKEHRRARPRAAVQCAGRSPPGLGGNWFIPPPVLLSHVGHCCGEAQGYNMETAWCPPVPSRHSLLRL